MATNFQAELVRGTQHKVNWTPGSDVSGGDVVTAGDITLIASVDEAAGGNIGMNYPSGTATYRVPKDGAAYSLGDKVYWDGTKVDGTNTNPGFGIVAADAGAGDSHLLAVHDNIK